MNKETMHTTILNLAELLSKTCSYLQTVQNIRLFSRTNKHVNLYLTKSTHGVQHWADAGLETCGIEYWEQPETNVIYSTMLQMCPWMSTPTKFPIIPLLAANSMRHQQRKVEVLELLKNDEPGEEMLCIKVSLDINDPTQEQYYELDAPRNNRQYEDYTQYSTYSLTNQQQVEDTYAPQERDDAVIEQLSTERWDRYLTVQTMLHAGNILKVHQGVFAAVKSDDAMTIIIFASYRTHKVLQSITIDRCSPRCIVIGTGGKMWCASSMGLIHYFGPRGDRHVKQGPRQHRSIKYVELTQMYWDLLDGKVTEPNEKYSNCIGFLDAVVSSGSAAVALRSLIDRWPSFIQRYGSRALKTAVELKQLDIVNLLIKAKAVTPPAILFHFLVRSPKHIHHTPTAIIKVPKSTPVERKSILQLLLTEARADPNARVNGIPLICAWARDYEEEEGFSVLPPLLQHGCKINATDDGVYTSRTALMIAAERDSIQKFTVLLDNDADPTIPDASGMTVMEYVREPLRQFTFGHMMPTLLKVEAMHLECKRRMERL